MEDTISLIDSKVFAAIIAATVSLVLSLITTIVTSIQYFHSREAERRKEKREIISQRLNEFYGPLLSHLNISKSLYLIFKSDKPSDFRLLPYLLEPEQKYTNNTVVNLSNSDNKLIKEIISTCEKIEDLVLSKGGLVDDKELSYDYKNCIDDITDEEIKTLGLLSRAIINFRVVRMAYQGDFKNNSYDTDRLNRFTYPKALNKKIINKIDKLQKELGNNQ